MSVAQELERKVASLKRRIEAVHSGAVSGVPASGPASRKRTLEGHLLPPNAQEHDGGGGDDDDDDSGDEEELAGALLDWRAKGI